MFLLLFGILIYNKTSENYTNPQLPTSTDVTVRQKPIPSSSSVNVSYNVPAQKTRSDIAQINITPHDDPSPETQLQNDRQFLLPYGIIDKSFIFSIFFPLVSLWFPCLSGCNTPSQFGTPSSSPQKTVLSLFDTTQSQNFIGFLVMENGQNMSVTKNINEATEVSLVPITGFYVDTTPNNAGGFYVKTADGTNFINSTFGVSGNQIYYSQTYIYSGIETSNTYSSIIIASYSLYRNNLAVSYPYKYAYPYGNPYGVGTAKHVAMMNNPIATPPIVSVFQPQLNSPSANTSNTPFATGYVQVSVATSRIFSNTTDNVTSYLTFNNSVTGTTTDVGKASTVLSVTQTGIGSQSGNNNVLIFDNVTGVQYNNIDGYSPVDSPCLICLEESQTQYPYIPIPYKINRIICREKTADNTAINNYAFCIDATSGLQYAYIKKYLIGLGAVCMTATEIIADDETMKQNVIETNEELAEYQKGYSDGYARGLQTSCRGMSPPDDTFSELVGDMSNIISVASFFL
jgi:hypothetical protein